ncbi:MAG: reverse transcriptase family protein [Microbacteriaceae bacterium]|nr:reverse transcriptase family protein [Microbacteriaceae bacterium]
MLVSLKRIASVAGSSESELRQLADEVEEGQHFHVYRARLRRRDRSIYWPDTPYDTALKQIRPALERLLSYEAPQHVYGFVKRRSTRQNAANHLDADCVLTIDLADFFASIKREAVIGALGDSGADKDASEVIGRLTTPRGVLGMGLSTSPYLSNLVFLRTDDELASLATSLDIRFTRYVDDLTFSGAIDDKKAEHIKAVLISNGWTVNDRKTRFMRRGRAQYVTGLSVSDAVAPRAPRRLKRRMRWRLNMIERYGFYTYVTRFSGGSVDSMLHEAERLRGLAQYIASVEPNLRSGWLERWYRAVPTTSHRFDNEGDTTRLIKLDEDDIRRLLEDEAQ